MISKRSKWIFLISFLLIGTVGGFFIYGYFGTVIGLLMTTFVVLYGRRFWYEKRGDDSIFPIFYPKNWPVVGILILIATILILGFVGDKFLNIK